MIFKDFSKKYRALCMKIITESYLLRVGYVHRFYLSNHHVKQATYIKTEKSLRTNSVNFKGGFYLRKAYDKNLYDCR
jgi:hypothetical protein